MGGDGDGVGGLVGGGGGVEGVAALPELRIQHAATSKHLAGKSAATQESSHSTSAPTRTQIRRQTGR